MTAFSIIMILSVTFSKMATAASSNLSEPWQVDKSLTECNQYMLEHGVNDVIFKLTYRHATEQ